MILNVDPPAEVLVLAARTLVVMVVWILLPQQYRTVIVQWMNFHHNGEVHQKPNKGRQRHCRHVSFGQLEVLEFPSVLGDNPSVRVGAPITLSWWPIRKSIYQVDALPDRSRRDRPRALPPKERELLLLGKGYDFIEIEQASQRQQQQEQRHCQKLQKQQQQRPNHPKSPFWTLKNKFKMMATRKI